MDISGFVAYPSLVETAHRPANTDVDTTPPAVTVTDVRAGS